jgi:hypothetical protein
MGIDARKRLLGRAGVARARVSADGQLKEMQVHNAPWVHAHKCTAAACLHRCVHVCASTTRDKGGGGVRDHSSPAHRAFPSWKRSILTEIYLCLPPVLVKKLRMETPLQSARRKLRRARSKWANSAVDMAKARRAGERGASSLIYELQREARFRALQEEQLVRPPPTPPRACCCVANHQHPAH